MSATNAVELDALFRRESGRILAALVRRLGPAHVVLAEDVVQDALVSATIAWRFGLPDNPTAWTIEVAKNRAVDVLRRERRFDSSSEQTTEEAIDGALSPEADGENQLAMRFALCDEALSVETHVTLILRLLCGFSPAEIAHAFMVDVGVIDRRLHRGRGRLREIGTIRDVRSAEAVSARQSSVEHALYLLFNEGYHGSDSDKADSGHRGSIWRLRVEGINMQNLSECPIFRGAFGMRARCPSCGERKVDLVERLRDAVGRRGQSNPNGFPIHTRREDDERGRRSYVERLTLDASAVVGVSRETHERRVVFGRSLLLVRDRPSLGVIRHRCASVQSND